MIFINGFCFHSGNPQEKLQQHRNPTWIMFAALPQQQWLEKMRSGRRKFIIYACRLFQPFPPFTSSLSRASWFSPNSWSIPLVSVTLPLYLRLESRVMGWEYRYRNILNEILIVVKWGKGGWVMFGFWYSPFSLYVFCIIIRLNNGKIIQNYVKEVNDKLFKWIGFN